MAEVKKGETVVVLGTKKGLFVLHSEDRKRWRSEGPFFEGHLVKHAALDPRDGRTVYAGVVTGHWGATVQRSTDFGESWNRGKEGPHYSKDSGLSVDAIWHIQPGLGGELWVGVEPAGLFRSDDGGDTWSSIDGLNYREGRDKWQPGAGGLCLHTILPYPREPKRMLVGISAVGVLGTNDEGESWRVMNGDVRADFLPEKVTKEDQTGSCVHKIVRDSGDPAVVYQQNHCGVYRRTRGDLEWTTIENGLPSGFGFPMAAHPHEPGTVYVVPLVGDFNRLTPHASMAVYRTSDRGENWQRLSKGLPQKGAYLTILREAMQTDQSDPLGVYVGTETGQLFYSRNGGDSWETLTDLLPPISSVDAGTAGGT